MSCHSPSRRQTSRSWEPVADWYAGWAGAEGSKYHRAVAVPALLDLLAPVVGERVLDVGCGPGVLAPHVAAAGARFTGIDASPKLIRYARQNHGRHGRFIVGDATLATFPANSSPRFATNAALSRASIDHFITQVSWIKPIEKESRTAGTN